MYVDRIPFCAKEVKLPFLIIIMTEDKEMNKLSLTISGGAECSGRLDILIFL